jgi:hypothetical protein
VAQTSQGVTAVRSDIVEKALNTARSLGRIVKASEGAIAPPLSDDDKMLAIHNTRPDRLEKADALGGFAVPSIAIAKLKHGFHNFGGVSMIGDQNLVTPSRTNPVFGADVYSPRFPSLNDEGTKIFRGFTNMGNRRYAPLNMTNIVREMKGNIRAGEGSNYGAGSVRAMVTPQFRSIKDLQKARDKLESTEDFEPKKQAANREMSELAAKFHPHSKYFGDQFQHDNAFGDILGEVAKKGSRELNEHYKDLTPEHHEAVRAFLSKLKAMPSEYFEAKPQRGVGIHEFSGAVVPHEDAEHVVPILHKHGIHRIEHYKEHDREGHRAALKKFSDLGFHVGGTVPNGRVSRASGGGITAPGIGVTLDRVQSDKDRDFMNGQRPNTQWLAKKYYEHSPELREANARTVDAADKSRKAQVTPESEREPRVKALIDAHESARSHEQKLVRDHHAAWRKRQTMFAAGGTVERREYVIDGKTRHIYERMPEAEPPDVPVMARKSGGRVNHAPSEAQKTAGNYAKHHLSFQGVPIAIENRKGSTRRGVDASGKAWSCTLPADYGYIKRTTGADGDHVDVYVGPDKTSPIAFIINQHDHKTNRFDEHKIVLGVRSEREAKALYCAAFSDGRGRERLGSLEPVSVDALKGWLKTGKTVKPARTSALVDRALEIARGARA